MSATEVPRRLLDSVLHRLRLRSPRGFESGRPQVHQPDGLAADSVGQVSRMAFVQSGEALRPDSPWRDIGRLADMNGDISSCPFCPETTDRYEQQIGTVAALLDAFPVSAGHYLVVPLRHISDYFEMTEQERIDTIRMLGQLRDRLLTTDPTIVGFNVGINCGAAAGQTVPHAHIHLIPRRHGDTPQPRGGVRGVIPERMGY